MGWKVDLHPSVSIEINDAIDWYGMQSSKAASNLMSDIAGRLNALEVNPILISQSDTRIFIVCH